MINTFDVRLNATKINSVSEFCRIKNVFTGNCKNVSFVRISGFYDSLPSDIYEMDRLLSAKTDNNSFYFRLNELPRLNQGSDIDFYSQCYDSWTENKSGGINIKTSDNSGNLKNVLGNAVDSVLRIFKKLRKSVTPTIEKNFCIKLMFRTDYIIEKLNMKWNEKSSVKVVCTNVTGIQEYLFFYLLTLIGFDVLLIQCEMDIDSEMELLNLSESVTAGEKKICEIRKFTPEIRPDSNSQHSHENIKITLPERPRKNSRVNTTPENTAREKSLEELAMLASSVVLIAIHDENGNVVGTGSGIMIGHNGFILTNYHVASGGRFYSVQIENDDRIYETNEIIKYNPVNDLAVIRIDRTLEPIPVYKGDKKPVRGQRVVAIGSPLGLLNTVSDGIISGFRNIHNVDMIQYTAPTSHGSSGGALLNMNGEVIGISTAGFDSGQNINLAVGYECINTFIKGFT